MTRAVLIDGARFELAQAALLGQGGEAEVYDLGDGRVLKWWKPADHPDFVGQPDAQAAATRRLIDAPARIRALPGGLPAAVVAPSGFALTPGKQLAGFTMPKICGEPLMSYGEVRWRRDHAIAGDDLTAMLLALHDAIAGLHRVGVVIGDCNDLNVLVDGRRVHLIDVDSYQVPGLPCPMFSERFLDPRLCDGDVLAPRRPHDAHSDWYAFAVMVFRTLLHVGPWGGVHPKHPTGARALRRISVLAPGVVYPRAARAVATLPDDLVALFRAIFEGDQRGEFPRAALAQLRLRRCAACGDEHARTRCPTCATTALAPPVVVHGRLRWQVIPAGDVAVATRELARTGPIYLDQGALYRTTRLGPERIGNVLAHQTRAWVGAKLGVGFYRAGGFAVGFVFRPDRGILDDRVALPKIRGQLVDAHATIGDDRAWLWLTCADGGRLVTTCVVIAADATVLATETLADATWLAGVPGACAVGPHLFVPTDDGIARIELVGTAIAQTRTFAETAPLISAGDRLVLTANGIDAIRRRDAIRMHLS